MSERQSPEIEPTDEQKKELERRRIAYAQAKAAGSADELDLFKEYHDYATELLIDLSGKLDLPDTPPPEIEHGYIKPGGWGADPDPSKWLVTSMKKPPEEFKVVDGTGINVATNFKTQAGAQSYINEAKGGQACPIGQHFDVESRKCVIDEPGPVLGNVDQFGLMMVCPSKQGGVIETGFKLEAKKRNYNSGKPSEWSTEYTNVSKNIVQNVEVTMYIKINGFKKNEADSVSLKLGGPNHSDGKCCWVIPDFMTDGSSKKTMEVESPHPHNHPVNPKPKSNIGGSIVGKWFGFKGISYQKGDGKTRHVESWIHFPVDNIDTVTKEQDEWRQYISTDLTDSKYYSATGKLTTSRLDGSTQGSNPEYKYASLREIQIPKA